jgi:hypothetical protein
MSRERADIDADQDNTGAEKKVRPNALAEEHRKEHDVTRSTRRKLKTPPPGPDRVIE